MILQALNDYYHRLRSESLTDIASEGFQKQSIPFVITLNREGKFLGFLDTRSGEGKKKTAREFIVPKGVKKTSGIAANLLWETPAYIFARPKPNMKKDREKLLEKAIEQQQLFIDLIRKRLSSVLEDEGVYAVLKFMEGYDFEKVFEQSAWAEIEQNGACLSFQLEGDNCLVCERSAVVDALSCDMKSDDSYQQACLITGKKDEVARLHTAIKGVWGAQTSGGNIVSFNCSAFTSYGKIQSFNAPVGKTAESAYTTALNHLLARGSRQRMQVGDASTVFWAEKQHDFENILIDLFGDPPKGEPEQDYKQLIAAFRSPQTGILPQLDVQTRFFVLGLSPNAARISVRFWYANTVMAVAENLWRHFDDLEMIKGGKELRSVNLRSLLRSTALLGKDDNVPPNLAGDTMKAILKGTPYPQTLLSAAVRRCRAEHEITYPRASLIKAVLVREKRYYQKTTQEVGMSLDVTNNNIGYRLGRLFATLEKIQEEASPGINATIRDRFYGSASANPVAAFSQLMKLKNHHLAKLENKGRVVNFEKLICEIMEGLVDFPTHLSLGDQGRFAVGYYHQRQVFYANTKKINKPEGDTNHE